MPHPALPPGPRLPPLGQIARWIVRPGAFMDECRRRYGDVFTLHLPGEGAWVMVNHPDHVREVFTGDPDVLRAGEANAILEPLLGSRSVLLLDGAEHLDERRLLLPPLHGERLARQADLMGEIAEEEASRWPRGEPFAVWPRMQAITLEVIMRAVFGIEEAAQLDRLRTLLERMLAWSAAPGRLFVLAVLSPERARRWSGLRAVIDPVHDLLLEEIGARRRDPHTPHRDDILSVLVGAARPNGDPLSDVEIRDELMTLLVAGHETTATALAWAIERLVRRPEALDRLTAEVAAGEEAYAEAVVTETLRLRPVLPVVVRRLSRPFAIAGHELPAGVSVAPSIFLTHRRADLYPDPLAFRPERFLEHPPGTYTWIPFGGGVRRCLGASFALLEMKRVLAAVVRSGRLRPEASAPERVARRSITLTPQHGARAVLEGVAR